mgnify:CR=1 FL=1
MHPLRVGFNQIKPRFYNQDSAVGEQEDGFAEALADVRPRGLKDDSTRDGLAAIRYSMRVLSG